MCGILAIFGSACENEVLRKLALKHAKRLRHRGPDWSGVYIHNNNALAHERLSIVDVQSGAQPLFNADRSICLAVNGEIYNHKSLRDGELNTYPFQTGSDCEVIIPLYEKYGVDCVKYLDGMFSFVLYDSRGATPRYVVARDHMGIVPLYMGWGADGAVWFSSELKALHDACTRFQCFLPGHVLDSGSASGEGVPWYSPEWMKPVVPTAKTSLAELRAALEAAVVKRMMCDVPWGVLLSGGLDSSLVASIASRHAHRRTEAAGEGHGRGSSAWFPKMHSFCIGLKGSPDLAAARKVADFLGTVHHEFTFTVQDGFDALSDVVYHLETYDVTTIRAATPMFLMSRKIKAMGIKVVLSGEGADEVFGGYLYFHKCPNAQAFHEETQRKLKDLYFFDCLRANKSTSAWGVEARVPFLDQSFLATAMGMAPELKLCGSVSGGGKMEKHVLRQAFDTPEDPYLPAEVLWRQKEQFSDGVGYNWIDGLRAMAEEGVSDSQMEAAPHRFPHNPPATKEAYFFRSLFAQHFPEAAAADTVPGGPSIACSTAAAIAWDEEFQRMADSSNGECSGRAVGGVHVAAYTDAVATAAGITAAEERAAVGKKRATADGGVDADVRSLKRSAVM